MSVQCNDLDEEFQYYSHLILELVEEFNRDQQRTLSLWLRKLSDPTYNVSKLREKRNHYMLILCMTLCTSDSTADNLSYPFCGEPPEGALADLSEFFSRRQPRIFKWEKDSPWDKSLVMETCSVEPANEIGAALDMQYQFILHLTKPHVKIIDIFEQRIKAAKWIQALSCIDRESDLIRKGMRNDYMMLLSGYLLNKNLMGPFIHFPMEKNIVSLKEFCNISASQNKNRNCRNEHPATTTASFCHDDEPIPREGAFAFIQITNNQF